jgi:glucose/arabinose dehydrogenase
MRGVFFFVAFLLAACAPAISSLRVPPAFQIETIARIDGARELAALPNGDLLVGTAGSDVYIVPIAEGGAQTPSVFASFADSRAAGVTYAAAQHAVYVSTMHHVWVIPYHGESSAAGVRRIADVRSGPVAPGTDGDVHTTTSVAFSAGRLYVSAGSSCNASMIDGRPCVEVDPTRAAVSVMSPDGSGLAQRAKRIRNAIALTVNPQTGAVWVGDAGQDDLQFGHPYEFLDDLSAHPGIADYGWPECEENHHAYVQGVECAQTVIPLVELPAYSTIIGATFYPLHQPGAYAFPLAYRGGLFVSAHGSWHRDERGCDAAPARVVFVPMSGDRPVHTVDWTNPSVQWSDFVTGFQASCTERAGRPTGLAVGSKGSLFIADDDAGVIYRVRPKHG